MRNVDYVSQILMCCHKREEILIKGQSIKKYNHYFDRMRKLAQKLINENRQDELLPYLESDSIIIREHVACILFHFYPRLCTKKLQEIADMTIPTGLPEHLAIVAATANCNLKYGIPEDYP